MEATLRLWLFHRDLLMRLSLLHRDLWNEPTHSDLWMRLWPMQQTLKLWKRLWTMTVDLQKKPTQATYEVLRVSMNETLTYASDSETIKETLRLRLFDYGSDSVTLAFSKCPIKETVRRGGGLGSRPKKMYGERLGDGVEYHLMKPTPRR